MKISFFESVQSLIFLLELCWDAKNQFFLMLGFHVAVYSRVP